ncbi:DUF6193 family natural product biosynthesis protein [Streptomyces katrae]|uniref:DUF6193 family natural product biosynthesis protein n=1 Tax=Streptomyces katrae TaxID=68223 RepID=A0ABT7H3S7_9ACTN|nr:DUF6193 family natural product biosynthesis protein [Streptomyces katrae]MDK9500558.1 DUF6193 family natural product biosynthesis protein [Streptomyces katrae]
MFWVLLIAGVGVGVSLMRPDAGRYPEVAACGGDLMAALRAAAGRMGVRLVGLGEAYPPEGLSRHFVAALEAECGDVHVELRPERREVGVTLRLPLVGVAAVAAVWSLEVAIEVAQAWQAGVPLADMAARWEFLMVSPKALAHDQGRGAAYEWESVRRLPDRLVDHTLVEAAFRSPQLSSLFPMVSHGSLQFRRLTVSGPGSDVPSVFPLGEGRWRVICLWDQDIPVRTAGNVEEAVRLVVEGLPEGCGSALEVIHDARRAMETKARGGDGTEDESPVWNPNA